MMKLRICILCFCLFGVGCLKSPFRTYPDQIWPQRVGLVNYEQCVLEMGPPDKKELTVNGLVASWVTYREGYSNTLILSFDSKKILMNWNTHRHH